MPTTDQLQFEMQRRVILFNSGTTMPDNTVLGYEGNPNSANTSTPGQTLLYNSPRGTSYIELVNGNLWYKQQIPNTWINLTSGTASGTAGTSSQNNVVFTTGNQDISGVKNFYSRPTVNGSGVLLIGETGSVALPNTLVYITGDQTISGNKTFDVAPVVSGNRLITGVDLNSYATTINLFNTGSILDNKINSLSGSLSGSLTGNYVTKFNGQFTNTPTVNGTPVLLSGQADILLADVVYTTGNQNIDGTKNFYKTPTINGDGILSSGQGIIGGDLTGDLLSATINKLQGYPLSIISPSAGQTLIYNGETWIPGTNAGGGGGGGGLFYYFNFVNHNVAPSGGLPTNAYSALSLLGRNYEVGSGSFTSPDLTPQNQFHLVTHFVTASGDPGVRNIPAGLWDFNIWANTNSTNATQTQMKAVVNIYDPINSSYRYVSESDAVFLYDTTTPSQYILNVTMPRTGVQDYERIYIQLFGKKTTNPNRTITFYFDSYRPSHVHTTLPSVAGSGVVKVIDGVFQTPASTIVDVDVNPNANIQQSKIQNLTTDLADLNNKFSALSGNLINTGSILDEKINSLSGWSASASNLANTGSVLNNKINSLSGYVNSQDIVFSGQIASTGSVLDNKINSLSGHVNSQDIIFSGQIALTGSSLYNSIVALSGLFTGYTGSLDATFATDAQLFTTGSILDNKINSLSGYVNSQDIILSGQIASSGSRLDDKINALSGYVSGISAGGTLPSTIVYITGNQTISGTKTFANNLEVQGTGIFNALDLSNISEFNFSGTNINLINGNVNISGGTLYISGNAVLTGVNLNAYATTANLFATGSTLDNKINSLSGYVNSQDVIFSGQTFNTGTRLDNKINSLSGYLNSQDIIFSGQTALTGSILDNKINTLSGYVNSLSTSGQVFNTGSILDNKINALSGYVNSQDNIFSGQTANTGSLLNNKINSLSGVSVLTFGNQIINGNKTFVNNIEVSGTGIFQNINIINLNELIISGAKIIIGGDSGIYSSSNIYISGNQVLTGVDLSSYATNINLFITGSTLDNKINSLSGYVNSQSNSGQVFNTGSILDNKINSLSGYVNSQDTLFSGQTFNTGSRLDNKINSLSGYVNSQDNLFSGQNFNTGSRLDNKINALSGYVNFQDIVFSGQTFNTGSRLDNKINSLSGYVDSKSIVLPTTIVYTTGNQTISGNKNFVENVIVGDQTQDNLLVISGNKIIFGVYPTVNDTGIVYDQGNQIISGVKTFDVFPVISGNKLITGLDLSSYATNANLFATGSTLDNKINSLSGYVNSQSTSGQVFNTGSILNNKINSLSGYVNSQDIVFSGQTFNTGRRLDNKINSLSGYFDSKSITLPTTIVYTTGDQIISGNKTFINNINVSGTGIFNAVDLNNIDTLSLSGVDISITNGNVSLTNRPTVNGTGVVLSGELNPIIVNTGSILDNKINALSGYTNSQNIILSGQIASSGSNLYNSIVALSGLFTGYTGSLNATFATDAQLFTTGSILDNKINALSGYISGISAGGLLPNSIVYITGNQTISGNKNFAENVTVGDQTQDNLLVISGNQITFGVRPTVNGTGVLLSGEVSAVILPNTIVYTTGDQLISGNKTFLNNIAVSGTGSFNNVKVSNIDKLFLSGIDILITGNSSINVYNSIYISGNQVLTGSAQLGSYATIANLFATGSTLDNKINTLSGYVNSQDIVFSGQTFNTGSRLDTKINALSGYVDSKSITLPTTIVYTTGNQTISGNKNFAENVIVGDQTQDNILVISGNTISFGVYPTVNGTGIVYDQGNQTISGIKTFDLFPVVSGNRLITGVNLNPYATNANLFTTGSVLDNKINSLSGYVNSQSASGQIFNTGSRLDNKINSLSGYVNTQDIIFSGQTFNTGSRLDGKINSLSGYVNAQDIVFSGQTFNTGSRLDNKINALSGYVSGISAGGTLPSSIVYITGNQTISGIKTFANTGSFDTLQITNKKLSSYNYVNSNFIFGNTYINIANSSNNIIGTLPSGITSGINYYVKNLNTGILLITGSGQRTIDGFSNINLYKNESLQLLGVNNIGYTGWISLSVSAGVS